MPDTRRFSDLTAKERRAEFKEKNRVFASHYAQLAPLVFYTDYLFHDMDEAEFRPSIIMYEYGSPEDAKRWKRQAVFIDDLMDYCQRDDVAVNPCGYYNNFPKKQLMRRVYAFVMDIDEVRPAVLEALIQWVEAGDFPRPTVITNSGSGIHFFYVLDVALQVGTWEKFKQNFQFAERIYFALHSQFGKLYRDVQRHHLGQDYRIVGSLSKYGDVTTAWKCGEFWAVEDLAVALGVDGSDIYKPLSVAGPRMVSYATSIARTLGLDLPDMEKPREVYDFIRDHKDEAYQERERRREQAGKKKGQRVRGWYRDTWFRVYNETEAGNRFNAMRGLAIVAVKCNVSEEQFTADIYELSKLWQVARWDGDPFNTDNVEAIIRMFQNGDRYKNTSRARLEELFGWKWRGQKRRINGRKQAVHVKIMSSTRDVLYPNGEWRHVQQSAEQKIREYMQAHPEAPKVELKRELGISYPTIRKYYDKIRAEQAPAPCSP